MRLTHEPCVAFGTVKIFSTLKPGSVTNVFAGTFDAAGLRIVVADGCLVILHEGRSRKFVPEVEHRTFSGEYAARRGQSVLYVTERCVFALTAEDRFHVEAFLKSLVAPSATSAPGVMLAAEMELRFEQQEERTPESLVRRRWAETVARGEWQRREDQRRQREEEAVRLAHTRLHIARNLEKKGKITGALEFYNKIAREAPDTDEGREAATRVAAPAAPRQTRPPRPHRYWRL